MRDFLRQNWKFILLSRFIMIGVLYSSPVQGELKDCSEFKNDCEYYACVESNRNCGRFGYPKGFGSKYCLRFDENKAKFSKKGWMWLETTKNCLIQKLSDASDELTCKQLKKDSFKEHISCYADGGFCDLSKKDRKQIYKVIWPSLWRMKIIKTGIKLKKLCRDSKN